MSNITLTSYIDKVTDDVLRVKNVEDRSTFSMRRPPSIPQSARAHASSHQIPIPIRKNRIDFHFFDGEIEQDLSTNSIHTSSTHITHCRHDRGNVNLAKGSPYNPDSSNSRSGNGIAPSDVGRLAVPARVSPRSSPITASYV